MEQQLPLAPRLVVELVSPWIRLNLYPDQPRLPRADLDVAIGEHHGGVAQRLHFGADQRDAGLEALVDGVVVRGALVARDYLDGVGGIFGSALRFLGHER